MKIPYFVEDFLEDQLEQGPVIVTTANKIKRISELTFNKDGFFHGLEGKVNLKNYITRLIRFSREDITISINRILLTDIPVTEPRKKLSNDIKLLVLEAGNDREIFELK